MKEDMVDIIVEKLLNEAEHISDYKQKFIDFCKDKVTDLGKLTIVSEDDPTEQETYEILYTSKSYKQAQPLAYTLNNEDGYLMVANEEGEVFINSPMCSPEEDLIELDFDEISTSYYEYILEYWDDLDMDARIEDYQADKENVEKADTELVVPEPFKYYTNGGSVEVYCDKYPDLHAKTTTMKGTEYVQEHFDINGLWEVSIIDENGKWKERGYADGWQEAMSMLKQQYDACTAPTPKPTVTTSKGTFTTEEYNAKEDEVKEAYKKVLQNEMTEEEYNTIVEDALKMLHKNDIESAEFWAKHDLGLVKTVSEMEAEQTDINESEELKEESYDAFISNDTIGEIKEDGTVIKEFYGQGYIYKNFENYNKKSGPCYIAEYQGEVEYQEEVEYEDDISDDVPNTKNFNDMIEGEDYETYATIQATIKDIFAQAGIETTPEKMEAFARDVFEEADWQSIDSLGYEWLENWEDYEELDESKEIKVESTQGTTIRALQDELGANDLDTEYREAYAKALVKFKLVPNKYPVDISAYENKRLNNKQIQDITNYMLEIMSGDFQFGTFKRHADAVLKIYADISNVPEEQSEEVKPKLSVMNIKELNELINNASNETNYNMYIASNGSMSGNQFYIEAKENKFKVRANVRVKSENLNEDTFGLGLFANSYNYLNEVTEKYSRGTYSIADAYKYFIINKEDIEALVKDYAKTIDEVKFSDVKTEAKVEEEMKTENDNIEISELRAKVEDYITDDYHREEDFTDIEVSGETSPYMLELVRAKLDALSDEDIRTMAKEIDARDIDLMDWGNEVHSATKDILARMKQELSEVEDDEDYDELDESKSHNTSSEEFEMNCKAWREQLNDTAEFIKEFGDDDALMTLEELGNTVSKELANIGFRMGFATYTFTKTTDIKQAKDDMYNLVVHNIDNSELDGVTVDDILNEIGAVNMKNESLSSYDYIRQQAMMNASNVKSVVNFLNDLGISDDGEDFQINEEVIIDFLSRKGLTVAKTEKGYDIRDVGGKIGSMSYSTEIGKWLAYNKVAESIETKLAELELGANIEVPAENGVSFKIYRDEDEAHKDMYAIYTYKDGEVQEELDTGDVHISDIEDKLAELKSKLTESFDNCICPQCMEEITKLIPVETRDLAPEELDQLDGNEEDIIFFECPECGYRDKKEMFCESKLTESAHKELTELNVSIFDDLEIALDELYEKEELTDEQYDACMDILSDRCAKFEDYIEEREKVTNTDDADIMGIEADYVVGALKDMIELLDTETLTEAEEVSGTIKEHLNTGVLRVVDVDLYSLGSAGYLDNVPDTEEANIELDEIIQDLAPRYIKETLQEVLPSVEIYAIEVYHPREYNFSGDELEFDLVVSANEYNALKERVVNDEAFETYLKDNYSSYSGFVSFMADNKDKFETQENWKQMVQVIMFALQQANIETPVGEYLNEFLSAVDERFPEQQELEESKSFTDEEIKQAIDADLKAQGGYFTDDSAYDVVERLTGIKEVDKAPQDLVARIRTLVKDLDNWKEDNSINESATVEEKEMTIEEIKARIAEINKQLAYIRRRDRVCLAFGSEQEQYELNQEREQLRDKLKQAKKTEATHKYVSLEDMCNDLGKEIVKHNKVLSTDTGIENVFNFSDKNGGAIDSHRYYNDYVVVDKRPDKKTEATQDYSDPYKIAGKWFRYNYKYSEVEYITHASNEFGPIEVITSVGLSKDNWENKKARNEYLQGWAEELDAEANSLADDFIKNELPYLTESYDYSKHTTKEIIDRLLQIDPDKLFNIDMEELEIMVANKETNETGVAVPMMSGEGLFVYEGNLSGEDDKEYSIEEFDKAHVITGIKAWDVKAGEQVDINIFDEEFINGTKWSEETEEPNDNIIDQINDMEYRGIWVRYVAETNTVQFIVDQEKADKLQLEDTVVDTIQFRNQTPKEIKHYIDTELDKSLLTD